VIYIEPDIDRAVAGPAGDDAAEPARSAASPASDDAAMPAPPIVD